MMIRILTMAILIAAIACKSNRQPGPDAERIAAASAITKQYAQSPLARWHVRGHAAGADCGVLFVETAIVMEDSMVEALHYGAGAYDVYRGGVRQFSRDRAFRGVAYKDRSGRVWTYGEVRPSEVEALVPCGR